MEPPQRTEHLSGCGGFLEGFRGSHGENRDSESWGNPGTLLWGSNAEYFPRDTDFLSCQGRFWSLTVIHPNDLPTLIIKK